MDNRHQKRLKRYHTPGDLHELTFSCYLRRPLLEDDGLKVILCRAVDAANERYRIRLVAFVIMPEHVHLLIDPIDAEPDLPGYLAAIKRPSSFRIKQVLIDCGDPSLNGLTVLERPGKTAFRFWQEGAGYDRNITTSKVALAAVDYLHLNPVRRALVTRAEDWKWSSCRWYFSDTQIVDPDLPKIHGMRPGFLDDR
ncbi:MAG: transposase [Planctomycetia bacterium]|nr:transposase [Planctomycetia bacterium]